MPYKRHPSQNRKYQYSNPEPYSSMEHESSGDTGTVTINEIREIPLPNESERGMDRGYVKKGGNKSSFFEGLFDRITIEEIILLGLIFIMLEEGIEDEFLLIILIFILFTGM